MHNGRGKILYVGNLMLRTAQRTGEQQLLNHSQKVLYCPQYTIQLHARTILDQWSSV